MTFPLTQEFSAKLQEFFTKLKDFLPKLKDFFAKLKDFFAKLKVSENPVTFVAAKWLKKKGRASRYTTHFPYPFFKYSQRLV